MVLVQAQFRWLLCGLGPLPVVRGIVANSHPFLWPVSHVAVVVPIPGYLEMQPVCLLVLGPHFVYQRVVESAYHHWHWSVLFFASCCFNAGILSE